MRGRSACLLVLLTAVSIECQWHDEYSQYCTIEHENYYTTICTVTLLCRNTISLSNRMISSCCLNRHNGYANLEEYNHVILDFRSMNSDSFVISHILPNRISKNVVKNIKMCNAEIVSIPSIMLDFNAIQHFEITESSLEKIDLSAFNYKNKLVSINASHNRISVLDQEQRYSSIIPLEILDLSFNLIEKLPNNYFSSFLNLTSLNLSHNYITHLDVLTFEGLFHLKALNLSCNNLVSIGHSFLRFKDLQELILDNNRITLLEENNFSEMTQLRVLNLSTNNILKMEEATFQTLFELGILDLTSNNITVLSKNIFRNNTQLKHLFLSHNKINSISKGLFKMTNITDFKINNNSISCTVEKETFQGISESKFDLSNNKLQGIGSDAFFSIGSKLIFLNLSHSEIVNISSSAFLSTNNLTTLDISFNRLTEIDGYLKNLKQIMYLNVTNNFIKRLLKVSFEDLILLETLDLSFNSIKEIENESFKNLVNLKTLNLCNNHLMSTFTLNTLKGMIEIKSIFLINTEIASYGQYTFSVMRDLNFVNSSHGYLETLDRDAFNDTRSIEILDLSHNILQNFIVNNESIPELKELYLHNNRIQNITREMFGGFTKLVRLTLAVNNIFQVGDNSFTSLSKLGYLDLSYNELLKINGSQIVTITTLYSVSLKNVKMYYNFSLVGAASVQVIDMSLCNIDDIKARYIYKLTNATDLNLSSNRIIQVDKHSFQTMPLLSSLDLSSNFINYIQPGSFIHTNLIKNIYLQDNELSSLQYGVFDGLQNLEFVNLASNSLGSFDVTILHNSPQVFNIILDDNYIRNINLDRFEANNIQEVSLGRNMISCEVFINFKNYNHSLKVTTQALDYHSENVNGITCKTAKENVKTEQINKNIFNMSATFESLAQSIDLLRNTIVQHSSNNINTPVYVTFSCLITLSCLCLYLSYNHFKRKSRIMNVNHFSSVRHLATDIEME